MKKKRSQTELYGDILTDEAQYRRDIPAVALTVEQQDVLIARAKMGDVQAREQIILACYPYSEHIAKKYARLYRWAAPRIEYLDLLQIGMVRAIECLDTALLHENPFGVLVRSMCCAIGEYSRKWCSPIAAKRNRQGECPPILMVASLDEPLEDNPDESLATLLPDETGVPVPERSFDVLYQALDTLVPRQREAVERYYGVGRIDEFSEADEEVWLIADRNLSSYANRGVKALYKRLSVSLEMTA